MVVGAGAGVGVARRAQAAKLAEEGGGVGTQQLVSRLIYHGEENAGLHSRKVGKVAKGQAVRGGPRGAPGGRARQGFGR